MSACRHGMVRAILENVWNVMPPKGEKGQHFILKGQHFILKM